MDIALLRLWNFFSCYFLSSFFAFLYSFYFSSTVLVRGDKFHYLITIHCHQCATSGRRLLTFPRRRLRGCYIPIHFLYTYISTWIIAFESRDINYFAFFKMPLSISIFSQSQWLLVFLGLGFTNVGQVQGQFGAVRMENEGNVLSPRYYMGLNEGRLFERDTGVCPSGSHSCNYFQFLIHLPILSIFRRGANLNYTMQKAITNHNFVSKASI